jgi:hypothetical protein
MITKRVSLSADKSMGYGHLVMCCGKRQPVHIDQLNSGDWWSCMYCEKPLIIRIEDTWYIVGDNITI